jgi:CP family cyanate transporter-like MFS transporter
VRARRIGEAIAVLAVAATVRAPITSIPPQVQSLERSLHLSSSSFGLLTTIPLLCFAIAAPLPVSRLARRLTPDLTVLIALLSLTVAVIVRSLGGVPLLFLGTTLLGVSIAVLNVTAPAIIRRDYQDRITIVMPVYTAVLAIMASAGAGLSIPFADATTHDWRGGTMPWALVSFVALLLWLPAIRNHTSGTTSAYAAPDLRALLRDRGAWAMTLYMGTQSSVFYASVAWLPSLLQQRGYTEANAGALLGYTTLAGFVFTVAVPLAVGRGRDQRLAVAITALAPTVGYLGLALAGGRATVLFLTLIGVGHAALAVALVLIGMRTHSVGQTAVLSAMAQGVGYGIAAAAPVALGMLHEFTGSWQAPLFVLAALCIAQSAAGLRAAAPVE